MGENVSLFVAYSATSIVKTFRKNKWLFFFFFSKSLQYVSVILKNDMYYKTDCLTVILLNVCLLLVHVPQKYIGKKCSF